MEIPFESAKVSVNWPLQFNSQSPNLRELLLDQDEYLQQQNAKRNKSRRKSRSPSGQSVISTQSTEPTTPAPEAGELCSRCSKIDLDRIISKKPGFQKSLGPMTRWKPKRCVLCRFLLDLLSSTAHATANAEESYELWTIKSSQTTQNLWCVVDVPLLKIVSSNLFSGPGIPWILPHSANTWPSVKPLEPTIDFESAKGWLDLCLRHHGDACGSHVKPVVNNLRVIDCQNRVVMSARTEDDYLALSYTWGDAQHSVVDNTRHQQNASFLQLPIDFPETIMDAIKVTLQLGYRYLWVDAYCVDQTNSAEYQDQIRQMDAIYQNAVLTIIAAAGSGPRYGLPGVGHRRRKILKTQIAQYTLSPAFLVPELDAKNCAWITRAWTFQEGLLSTRRLLFTEEQVYFQCRKHHCTEMLDLTHEDVKNSKWDAPLQGVGNRGVFPVDGCGKHPWDIYSRITEYSNRKLSHEGDILNGIIGILRAFESVGNDGVD